MTGVECYEIRANGEWGTFFVRQGFIPKGEGATHDRYWCELTCNTSFGCVGYHWGHMGSPAHEFLASCDRGYIGGKLWGADSQVFDIRTATESTKELINEALNDGDIDEGEAFDMSRAFDIISSENEWYAAVCMNDPLQSMIMQNCGIDTQADNPQMVGFFRELWPAFIAELTAAKQEAA